MSNNSQDNLDIEPLLSKDGDAKAQRRFNRYKSCDPFPEIIPALLNSADIYDYIRVTGMICPFDPKKLKSASYEISILGLCIYWDEDGKKQEKNLKKDEEFILKANSIALVSIEPKLRIPDYIALRFNLKIKHIHKGILLGTGPLVDPGYVGKLLIPLHNLTTNNYIFQGGEGLIWMEFTKLSYNKRWHHETGSNKRFSNVGILRKSNRNPAIPRFGKYVLFPGDKSKDNVNDFIIDIIEIYGEIRSSLPNIIVDAKKSAENAEKLAKDAQQSAKEAADNAENAANTVKSIQDQIIFRLTIGGIVTAIATFLALYFTINALTQQINSLVQDSVNYVKNTNDVKEKYGEKIKSLEEENKKLREEMKKLNDSFIELKKNLNTSKEEPPKKGG